VTVNGDVVDEDDETFTLTLANVDGATIVRGQATGTIRDDDAPPVISIDDATVNEGNSGTVNATLSVTLSNPSSKTVTVDYATGGGTATAGADYEAASGSLSFAPLDETAKTLTVRVKGDLVDEPDETFFVTLAAPSNATLGDAQGQVTILDDDIGASLAVNDVSVQEGNWGTRNAVFTVTLSSPVAVKVKVRYATQHVTTTNQDLVPTSGQLVFQPGQTAKTVAVPVKGDTLDENDETFLLRLSAAEGSPIGDAEGVGTILDDDPPPALSIADVSVKEGNSGTRTATFVVTLSAKSGRAVSVSYATRDGTASAGLDYTPATGSLTFAPGETAKCVPVPILGDKTREANEKFYVDLSSPTNATLSRATAAGTILNDD
jgi:chitinase